MVTRHHVLLAAAALVVAVTNTSCGTECGPGTISQDGTCVPGNGTGDAKCGMGTKLGPQGTCIPDPPTVCDPDTTREVVDPDTGVVVCQGTGGSRLPCTVNLPCPAPTGTKLTMCGRLYDTETDLPVPEAANATGEACTAASATGPCHFFGNVKFYDALEFSMNPGGAMQIAPTTFELDDCGRYVATNMTAPSFGFIGMGTDDAAGQPDTYRLTGVATSNALAKPARNFRAYVTKNTTDTAWTTSSGITGSSFGVRGVLAAVFRYQGNPVAGVRVLRNGNPTPAADDWYFSDTGIGRTTVAAAQNVTGPNGTALVINTPSATNHSGMGAEPAGCAWPESLAASIPNVVFVQLKDATTTTTSGVPCP